MFNSCFKKTFLYDGNVCVYVRAPPRTGEHTSMLLASWNWHSTGKLPFLLLRSSRQTNLQWKQQYGSSLYTEVRNIEWLSQEKNLLWPSPVAPRPLHLVAKNSENQETPALHQLGTGNARMQYIQYVCCFPFQTGTQSREEPYRSFSHSYSCSIPQCSCKGVKASALPNRGLCQEGYPT